MPKIIRKCTSGKYQTPPFQLKLVQILVLSFRFEPRLAQLAPAIDSQGKRQVTRIQIEVLFTGNHEPPVVSDTDVSKGIEIDVAVKFLARRDNRILRAGCRAERLIGVASFGFELRNAPKVGIVVVLTMTSGWPMGGQQHCEP